MTEQGWIVPWAMWVWAGLFAALVGFELLTLYLNRRADDGTRRNLTALVQAYFRTHKTRRLKYHWPRAALIACMVWGLLHFLGYV